MNEMGVSLRSGAFPLKPFPGKEIPGACPGKEQIPILEHRDGTGAISLSVVEFASSCLLAKTSRFMYRKVYHSS
jgi:hypothetical protein